VTWVFVEQGGGGLADGRAKEKGWTTRRLKAERWSRLPCGDKLAGGKKAGMGGKVEVAFSGVLTL